MDNMGHKWIKEGGDISGMQNYSNNLKDLKLIESKSIYRHAHILINLHAGKYCHWVQVHEMHNIRGH